MNPRYRVKDLNLHTSMEGIPLLQEGSAILEVKVQNSVPLWLSAILNKEKIYQTSFSKVGSAHKKELLNHLNKKELIKENVFMIKRQGGIRYEFVV